MSEAPDRRSDVPAAGWRMGAAGAGRGGESGRRVVVPASQLCHRPGRRPRHGVRPWGLGARALPGQMSAARSPAVGSRRSRLGRRPPHRARTVGFRRSRLAWADVRGTEPGLWGFGARALPGQMSAAPRPGCGVSALAPCLGRRPPHRVRGVSARRGPVRSNAPARCPVTGRRPGFIRWSGGRPNRLRATAPRRMCRANPARRPREVPLVPLFVPLRARRVRCGSRRRG